MSKVSGLDRAIAETRAEIAFQQAVLAKLEAHRQPAAAKLARTRKVKPAKPEPAGHEDAGNR